MSISKLNQKAISGKLKVADYIVAALAVGMAIYLYVTNGLTTTTWWFVIGAVVSLIVAVFNPSKKINDAMLKKQSGKF